MNIIGISAFYHDSAAALVVDGEIIAAAQEERFTRIKHDHRFPKQSIEYCLKAAGLSVKDIDIVVFYDKPFLKFDRLIETYLQYAPLGLKSFLKSAPVWIKKKIWMKDLISTELGYEGEILFSDHHISHAAAAFYPSQYEESAILTMDGVGEWTTTSYGVGKGNDIRLTNELNFPHSLGLLYSAFTYYLGFKVNSGEYKVMGLAPYGEPKYVDLILDNLVDLKDDGSFRLNMKHFNYCAGLTMTNNHFADLFGAPAREKESGLTQREMDIARSVQEVTERIILKTTKHVRKTTDMKNLCLSGGVALNCVANGKILKENIFDSIWIQPAAGDAGSALGAALLVWYKYLDNKRTSCPSYDFQKGSYLGPSYSSDEIREYLNSNNIPYKELSKEELSTKVSDLIAAENVIGWFSGKMEFGPRALGARSIIGDARSPEMQSKLNLKIKFRESFRPFAPAVLEEKAQDYFDVKQPSPYMLIVGGVNEDRLKSVPEDKKDLVGLDKLKIPRSDIPAVTHVDCSARVQTVTEETNPSFYSLISNFNKNHDSAVVINTSFNVRGEPIVCTPDDAYRCFMRTHMDYLVLENFLLDKKEQPKVDDDEKWKEEFALD